MAAKSPQFISPVSRDPLEGVGNVNDLPSASLIQEAADEEVDVQLSIPSWISVVIEIGQCE